MNSNSSIIQCVKADNARSDKIPILTTKIHLHVQPKTLLDFGSAVYAVRSSMTRITTTYDMDNVEFWVELRRQPWLTFDLKARWYRRFRSPSIGIEGAEETKLVEYVGSMWTSKMPTEHVYFIQSWTPTTSDLRSLIPFNPGINSMTGNYTVYVTDHKENVYFSKTFELIVISEVKVQDVKVFELGVNENVSENFADIIQDKPVDNYVSVETGKTYLIMCRFYGNPISAANANIFKNKFDCPPLSIVDTNAPALLQSAFHSNNKTSSDGTSCTDFVGYGQSKMLPIRYGTDVIFLSTLTTFEQSMQYGCLYNSSFGK